MGRNTLSRGQLLFLDEIALAMQHAAKAVGGVILVCTGIAQALDESDWGEAAPGHNCLGIKAGLSWTGPVVDFETHEVIHGEKVPERDEFRAYASYEECCTNYARIISTRAVYRPALAYLKNADVVSDIVTFRGQSMPVWEAYTMRIAAVYATNPKYGRDLVDLIRTYDLLGYELPA